MKKTTFKANYIRTWIIFLVSLGLATLFDAIFFDFFDKYRGPDIFPNTILGPILILFQILTCYYLYQASKRLPLKIKNQKIDILINLLFFGGNVFIAFIIYAIVGLNYVCSMGIDCI